MVVCLTISRCGSTPTTLTTATLDPATSVSQLACGKLALSPRICLTEAPCLRDSCFLCDGVTRWWRLWWYYLRGDQIFVVLRKTVVVIRVYIGVPLGQRGPPRPAKPAAEAVDRNYQVFNLAFLKAIPMRLSSVPATSQRCMAGSTLSLPSDPFADSAMGTNLRPGEA